MLTRDDVRIPSGWEIWAGGDTGTYMGGCCAAISPQFDLVILDEYPNYHYTGDGTIEELRISVSEWIEMVAKSLRFWTKQRKFGMWVDANTTFKSEVGHGLRFLMNKRDLELRTEITREYQRNGRIKWMPWVSIIPYEMELARFPERETSGMGRFRRVKEKDHCLDGLEHICSRRPHPKFTNQGRKAPLTGIEAVLARHRTERPQTRVIDPHLGIN